MIISDDSRSCLSTELRQLGSIFSPFQTGTIMLAEGIDESERRGEPSSHKKFELIIDSAWGYIAMLRAKSIDGYVFDMSGLDVSVPNLLRFS